MEAIYSCNDSSLSPDYTALHHTGQTLHELDVFENMVLRNKIPGGNPGEESGPFRILHKDCEELRHLSLLIL
jgi:hypothetical protein